MPDDNMNMKPGRVTPLPDEVTTAWQPPAGDFASRPWAPAAPYYSAGGIDIRDVIEAFGLNYNRGAVVKYIARAGRKPGNGALLDLLKAREHVNREIAALEASSRRDIRANPNRAEPGPDHQAERVTAVLQCPDHPHLTAPRPLGGLFCISPGCGWFVPAGFARPNDTAEGSGLAAPTRCPDHPGHTVIGASGARYCDAPRCGWHWVMPRSAEPDGCGDDCVHPSHGQRR